MAEGEAEGAVEGRAEGVRLQANIAVTRGENTALSMFPNCPRGRPR